MTDPTWSRVEDVFHRTRSLPPDGRVAVLEELTADAPDVRQRVEALLAAHDRIEGAVRRPGATGFLNGLDADRAGALLASAVDVIGRYRVERLLGRGGMGEVYLAHDPRLGRPVALKLLPRGVDAQGDAWARVLAEARASSALDHPNIATVYDVGRSDRGPYVAMAYYPGRTLRARLEAGPFRAEEATAVARAVAEGLAAAHAAGIVHRDVKPENLLLGPDGSVRIVDFGIARVAAHVTGSPPRGTVAYMSPEQARGQPVDVRSDVWSLGVVLYEMLAGRRPFVGDAPAAVVHAIRHDPPDPLPADVCSPELDALVRRCLSADPAERFADGAEVAAALRDVGSRPRGPAPHRFGGDDEARGRARSRGRKVAGAGIAALAVAVLAGVGRSSIAPSPEVPDAGGGSLRPEVVLADFATDSAAGPVGRAVTEALRIDLHQSAVLRMVDPNQMAATLERMGRSNGGALTEEVAREVAIRDGYAAVVTGTVRAFGRGWLLTARAMDGDGGTVVAVRETATDSTALVGAVDRLAKRLRVRLGESAAALRAARPLPEVATASLPALMRYAEAHTIAQAGGDQSRTVALLEDAVAFDPDFAAAHRSLSVALWNMRADRTRVVRATSRAYGLRDRLGSFERHLAEAAWHWQVRGDPVETVAAYRRALHLRPRHAAASNNLALALMFLNRAGEAERVLRDATASGTPGEWSGLMHQNLARALYLQGRVEEGYAVLGGAAARRDGDPTADLERARWLAGDGRWAEAESAAAAFVAAHADRPQLLAEGLRLQWHLALTRGRLEEAEGLYGRMDALLRDIGAVEASTRAALRRADARRQLLGDVAGARRTVRRLVEAPDLDLFRAGAGLAPRAASLLAAVGDTTTALELLARWDALPLEERSDPDAFSPAAARARVDLAGGRPDSAVRRLEALVENNIQAVDYLPDLAAAYRDAGRPEDARAALEQFLSARHPRRPHRVSGSLGPALVELAALLAEAGRVAEARQVEERLAVLWNEADQDVRRVAGLPDA